MGGSAGRASRRRGERRGQRLAIGESLGGVARKTPVDGRAERGRQPRCGAHDAWRRLGRLAQQQGGQVGRLEGQATAHREVADDAERVDVAAPIDGFARRLLGAHEVRGAHDLPRIGHGARVLPAVRDAEVGHQCAARARLEQDVVRLHVAVHDAAPVRVGERPRHLAQDARRLGRREGTARANPLAQRLALDVAHDEEDEAAGLADAMDGDDVRVREAGRHAGLADEPLARRRGTGEVGREDLDGDVAIELHVAREVDDPHAATAELALDRVLTGQGGLQVEELGGGMRHGLLYHTK